jgi:glutathione peroxidase
MKKSVLSILFFFYVFAVNAQESDFYQFKIKTLDGGDFDFSSLKGKKVLIVNTASKCGFTPQYAQLQELYKKYGGDKFTIIGFPSNDFLEQEPGDAKEIREFCTKNYGVTFLLAEKNHVKGKNQQEVYYWLTHKKLNHFADSKVKWNFQKYLIDENGHLIQIFYSSITPMSDDIVNAVK